jgi:hypothetical protein
MPDWGAYVIFGLIMGGAVGMIGLRVGYAIWKKRRKK